MMPYSRACPFLKSNEFLVSHFSLPSFHLSLYQCTSPGNNVVLYWRTRLLSHKEWLREMEKIQRRVQRSSSDFELPGQRILRTKGTVASCPPAFNRRTQYCIGHVGGNTQHYPFVLSSAWWKFLHTLVFCNPSSPWRDNWASCVFISAASFPLRAQNRLVTVVQC